MESRKSQTRKCFAGFSARLARTVITVLVLVGLLAIGKSTTASAAEIHVFSSTFGSGELSLSSNSGIAVSGDTGDVYVADTGHNRVAQFSGEGVPIRVFGTVASPAFIAVDNSTGVSKGDVYVANATDVFKFDSEGHAITTWGANGILDGSTTPNGPFSEIGGIGIGPDGALYVYSIHTNAFITKISAAGVVEAEQQSPYGMSPSGIAVDGLGHIYVIRGGERAVGEVVLTADKIAEGIDFAAGPATGIAVSEGTHVYVGRAKDVKQYAPSTALIETFGSPNIATGAGVAVAEDGTAYVSDSSNGDIDLFTSVLVPDGTTEAPEVGRNSAIFRGSINPLTGPPATCVFEYTSQAKYEHEKFVGAESIPCEPSGPYTGATTQPVEAHVSGLSVETRYVVRLVPSNVNGSYEAAGDVHFTTLPPLPVRADQATEITRTTALLTGTVTPEGAEVEVCEFEYVTRVAFEAEGFSSAAKAPCEESSASIGIGNAPVPVHARAESLSVATEYVFRLVGKNVFGTTFSGTASFSTRLGVNLITGEATSVTTSSATLNGSVDPEGSGVTSCFFEYVTQTEFEQSEFAGAATKICAQNQAQIGEGEGPVPVSAGVTGLVSNTPYRFRLAGASALASAKAPNTSVFETKGRPTVGEVIVKGVTATTAIIEAPVNPHGEPTTFQVEYFPAETPAQVVMTPIRSVEAGNGAIVIVEGLTVLSPSTAYGFHLLVENAVGTAPTTEGSFITLDAAASLLPDGRAYEMVSPSQKGGEVITPYPTELTASSLNGSCERPFPSKTSCLPGGKKEIAPMQATADGDEVAYFGQAFGVGMASGGNAYIGSRDSLGWNTESLSAPAFGEGGDSSGYLAYSSNLSRAILGQAGVRFSSAAPEREGLVYRDLYLRTATGLEPLIETPPSHRSPHPVGGREDAGEFWPVYAGANTGGGGVGAFTHVIFKANDALTAGAPEIPEGSVCKAKQDCDLYDWSDGELHLVNVLPSGKMPTAVDFGSMTETAEEGGTSYDGAISSDGSKIFWSEASGQVYVRIEAERTEKLSDKGAYVKASADGATVLLADGCLYELEAHGCIAQINSKQGGFEGILGTSEDLSHIYFIDTAALGGENLSHEAPVAGSPNLYAWIEGERTFIARLSTSDDHIAIRLAGDWKASAARRTAQVTPDGSFLAFMSERPLTGYDNEVLGGGSCQHSIDGSSECLEVFEYSAATGALTCPSCNPSRARPLGGANLSLTSSSGMALPEYANGHYKAGLIQPRNLTSDGRLFFESRDALTATDHNGSAQDVYESTPGGVRGCAKQEGCLGLISSGDGNDEEEAFFVTATPSASNVFFTTRRQLLVRDQDTFMDLYDAREGGGFSEPPRGSCNETVSPCRGEAASPPSQANSASSSVTAGNAKYCKKGFVKKHGRCVKRPKHPKKPHKNQRHTHGKNRSHNGHARPDKAKKGDSK